MFKAHSTTKRRTLKRLNASQRGQIKVILRLGLHRVCRNFVSWSADISLIPCQRHQTACGIGMRTLVESWHQERHDGSTIHVLWETNRGNPLHHNFNARQLTVGVFLCL